MSNAAEFLSDEQVGISQLMSDADVGLGPDMTDRFGERIGKAVSPLFEGELGIKREDLGSLVPRTPEEASGLMGLVKTTNDILIRGGTGALDLGMRLFAALPAGGAAAVGQALEELGVDHTESRQIERLLNDIFLSAGVVAGSAPTGAGAAKPRAASRSPAKMSDEITEVKPAPVVRPTEAKPEFAGNINLSKIETTEDIKNVLRTTAEENAGFMDARRGVQSFDDTRALADSMGMTSEQLLSRRKGQAFNAEEAVAARQIMVNSADDVVRLSKAAVGGTDEDLLAFQRALARHGALQEEVAGLTAEAGRALNSFKITVTEQRAREDAIRKLLERQGGREKVEDLALQMSQLDTPEAVAKFSREAFKPRFSDYILEPWINALLSGPQTHVVNMLSNSLAATWQIPERALAGVIGTVRGGGDRVFMRESIAQLHGMIEGTKDGLLLAGKTFLKGESADDVMKLDMRRPKAIPGLIGEAVRLPTRALMTEDAFFKTVGYRMELNALAMREGLAKGLQGDDLARFVRETVERPPESLSLKATDAAAYQTFTNDLGEKGNAFLRFANKAPAIRAVVPFIKTPTNLIKFSVERSPFGFAMKEVRDSMAAGGAARDIAIARMTMGSGISALAAKLAADGTITGGGPTDPEAKQMLRNTGWQPYSVKIGDTYYAYNRIEPLGTLLGVAADFVEISGELEAKESEKLAGMTVASVAKNLTSKTWLRGITELVQALEDPERYGQRYINQLIGTVVPTGVAQIERVDDPIIRDARTILDQIKSRIPGYSETLPARRNIWGDPIVLEGGLGPDLISPIYTSKYRADKVADEVVRLKVELAMPEKKIRGVELPPEAYSRYVELAGKPAKQTLDSIVASPGWAAIPDASKGEIIKRIVSDYRDAARMTMLAENDGQLLMETVRKKIKTRTGLEMVQ